MIRRSCLVGVILSYLPVITYAAVIGLLVVLAGAFRTALWLLLAAVIGYGWLEAAWRSQQLTYRGVRVTREDQPDLMKVVDTVMEQAGIRRLDGVWLTPGANAFALRFRRDLLGRRRLGVALGLLEAVHSSTDELKAILAHEAGHLTDSRSLRRLLAQRRRIVLKRLNRPLSRPARWYWRWFLKVTRDQAVASERHADTYATQMCGAGTYARAIQRGREASLVHVITMADVVRPCWDQRITPATLLEAYEEVWARTPEIIEADLKARMQVPEKPEDTHPGLAEITGGQIVPLPRDLRGNLPLARLEELDRRCTASLRQRERHYPMAIVTWAEIWAKRQESQPPAGQDGTQKAAAPDGQSRTETDPVASKK